MFLHFRGDTRINTPKGVVEAMDFSVSLLPPATVIMEGGETERGGPGDGTRGQRRRRLVAIAARQGRQGVQCL